MATVKGYFFFQRTLLRLMGLSLEGNEKVSYKIYSIIICVSLIIYLVLLVYDMIVNLADFDILIDTLFHEIAILTTLAKFLVVYINSKKIDTTLKTLEEGIFAPNPKRGGPIEGIWVAECVKNLNKLIIASWSLAFTSVGISVAATILKRIFTNDPQQWSLPFGVLSMFNSTYSPNFELAWFYESTMFTIASSIYLTTDILIVGVFSHIALQFKMLGNSIRRMVPNSKSDGYFSESGAATKFPDKTWNYLTKKLKEGVEYHMAILDLAQKFEEILNVLVLYNYLAALVALACLMFHASLYSPSDPRFQKDAILTLALMFQIFLTSHFGNEVTVASETVLLGCYEANFVGTDANFQKGLCIMMSRCQIPTTFTIGKFADLSLVLFVSVVRASVSYYMVLHNMNGEN